MVCSNTIKGICCIISAVCVHLILGNAYTWGNMNVYFASYIRLTDPTFTVMDGFFMVPTLKFVYQCTTSIGGYFEKYSGPKLFNIISIVCAIGSQVILYYTTNFWIIMTAMSLYGISWGTGYYTMLKQCWKYFPEKKGLITGIVLSFLGLGPFLFTSLADYMINPQGLPPVDGYFEREIALKTREFIFVLIIIMCVLGFISCCLMFPYVEDNTQVVVQHSLPEENKQIQAQTQANVYVQKERIKEVFRTSQFYLLGIIANGITFCSYLINNTYRTFGSINKLDETLLQTLSKVFTLLNGFSRFFWGYVFDKISFHYLYLAIILNHIICAFSYFFLGKLAIPFFIVNCFVSVSFAGHALFNPVMAHVFGIKNSIILIGLHNYIIGVFGLINPILCKFYIKSNNDYLVIYITGGSFALSAFFAWIFVKPEKYVYTWKSKREQEEFGNSKDSIEGTNIAATPLLNEPSPHDSPPRASNE